jgi:hypothetical protein
MKVLAFTHAEAAKMTEEQIGEALVAAGFDLSAEMLFENKIDGIVYSQGGKMPEGAYDPLKLIQEHEEKIKNYVESAILLASLEGHEELTYTKTPMTMPDGGMYLVSILHISGPKIKLQKETK